MVDEPLNLDTTPALTAVDQLMARLEEAGRAAGQLFADALASGISSADAEVQVGLADPGALGAEIEASVDGTSVEVQAGADTSGIGDEIDAAVADADPPPVVVDIDPSAIMGEIEDAVAAAHPDDIEVGVNVDDSGLNDLGNAADGVGNSTSHAAEGVGKLAIANKLMSGSAAAAAGETEGVVAASEGLLGPVGAAVGGVTALAGVMGEMVKEAEGAQTASVLMTRTFGGFREEIEHIDMGGFNGSLDDLARTVGSDNDQLAIVIARMGGLAQQTGASNDRVKEFTDGIALLSARAVVLNPNLGSASETAEGLTRAILRGGAALQRYSISLSDTQIAAEMAREGIRGNITDLPRMEQEMIKVNAATHALGSTLGSDIATGAATARIQFRSFREGIREDMEHAGQAILPLAVDLSQSLQPAIAGLIDLIGKVATAVLSVLGPVLKAVGPQLGELFTEGAAAIGAVAPLLTQVGALLAKVLPIVVTVGVELFKWTTPLGLTLQVLDKINEHAKGIKEAIGAGGESLDEMGRKLGVDQFAKQRMSLTDYVTTIKTAAAGADAAGISYEAWARAAERAGVSAGDVAGVTAELATQQATQASVVGTATAAFDEYSSVAAVAAGSTLTFGDAILSTQEATNAAVGHLLDLRGNADQAFFALLKLGSQGAPLMDELTASFAHGGLSAAEFTNVAKSFGLSLDDLASIETRARDGFEAFTSGIQARGKDVEQALGDVTDATKELDDKGKANIADFVAEVTKQLTAQAEFSNNIATLYETGANRTADAFLKAGPQAAGALQQLIDQGGPAIDETEVKLRGLADTAESSRDRAVKAAEDNAAKSRAAYGNMAPDPAELAGGIDSALLAATNELDSRQSGVVASATAIGSAIAQGMASGIAAGQAAINAAATDTIDGALLSAQSAAQIGSPSKLFAEQVGAPLVEGIAAGVSAKSGEGSGGPIYQALSGALDVAVGTAGPAFQKGSETIGQKVVDGVAAGITDNAAAVGDSLAATAAVAGPAASRLFSRDVGFPLTEGLAEGIRAGFFKVDDAIGDVIAGAQRAAGQQLDTVFGALSAGQSLTNARQRENDLNDKFADLAQKQVDLPGQIANAQNDLNNALVASQAITAREQQAIEQAQNNLDRIKAQLDFQNNAGPASLDEAQRQLALDQAEADRLGAISNTATNNATLGTGTDKDAQAAQQAFQAQQRVVQQSQQAVDQLTQKLQQNHVTSADLAVAVDDLSRAQADATGPTDALTQAQQHLKDVQDQQVQVNKDLLDVTNQIPAAQLAVLQATAAAAKAGEAFNVQGLAGMDILKGIAEQAGYSDTAIATFTKTWAGLASTIATTLGGGAFGAPQGQVDIGSYLGQASRYTDPTEALNELNFVRGLQGATSSLTMAQAPWNINIYQATDPNAVAFQVASKLGLSAVR